MTVLLLLLVCIVVCKGIDTRISSLNTDIIDERNLANLNTHHELASRYNHGDPNVIRRKLTRTPTKKPTPTKSFKPSTHHVSTRKPTRKAPSPSGGRIILPGTIFKDATTSTVYVVNTATQYTTYTSDGTCTTWPYHAYSNIFITATTNFKLSKIGSRIYGIDISDSSRKSTFTILNSNPYANKCISSKSSLNTYSNIIDTFKQGDKYQNVEDENGFW